MTLSMESVCQKDRGHYTKKFPGTKRDFVVPVMSSFLVNVSLAWYLLLLNFDLKDELADDLSASPSTETGHSGRGRCCLTYHLMGLFALGSGSPG